MSEEAKDGGTVETPETTLRDEALAARFDELFIAAHATVQHAAQLGAAAQVLLVTVQSFGSVYGFTPDKERLKRAATRLQAAVRGSDAPPASANGSKLVLP